MVPLISAVFMGKIRVKTLGDETQEEKQKKRQEARKTAKAPGLKGGERVVSIGPSAEEIEKTVAPKSVEKTEEPKHKGSTSKNAKKVKFKKVKAISKRYNQNISAVDKNTTYAIEKAVELLKKLKASKFDETVELHLNVKEKGISGRMTLPHGTGKQIRIKIADDALVDAVSKGKIDFDILVAEPSMMPKLARVAKILGPKGLMPNPKAGTISPKPAEVVEKLSHGQVNFKTEAQAPIIHMSVGKLSFSEKQLSENIKEALKAIGETKINNVTLKSTMSPAIKLQIAS